ncbi:imidazole glycerol phosphate synthase subunit HisF [Clostridium drakei]|uniref:Imidazole glycerol phosphate synthase subunit HisF n=1 Tax=Clostridium drakei TaxID=332101 RepID=A0A2U8DNC0_9CLOT|nr:imidazole glycerol phosphate synthase cyclase subunit [Clostridium drakei]AWI03682.1 imidazole glycerol phosphate synthase cyclase subunit [Clostridium drakei]
MLKVRIIPTLLWKDVGLVKGIGFNSWRRIDTVLPAIKVYNMRGVDELILLDISSTNEKREPDYESVKEFSQECFIPFTVGGGIKSIENIKKLLRSGADKVSINTEAFNNINLIREGAKMFGSQCIVVSIDAKKENGRYYCYSHSGTKCTGIEVSRWAKEIEKNGAGEIIITSIEKDGTMEGYDIDLINEITKNVKIPVIASGGAGNYEDMFKAIKDGKASAVAAASIFHFTEKTPRAAKMFLASKGIPVRK